MCDKIREKLYKRIYVNYVLDKLIIQTRHVLYTIRYNLQKYL